MSEAVNAEIEIAAPPAEVYALMMDPSRLGEWVTLHRGVKGAPEPPLSTGDEFEQEMSLAGKSFSVAWKVERAEPPAVADWVGRGPAGATARVAYRLEETAGGTRVRYENEFGFPAGFLGAIAGRLLVRSPAEREAEKTLTRLKDLLES